VISLVSFSKLPCQKFPTSSFYIILVDNQRKGPNLRPSATISFSFTVEYETTFWKAFPNHGNTQNLIQGQFTVSLICSSPITITPVLTNGAFANVKSILRKQLLVVIPDA
jgi:hypothetical protein